MSEMDEIAALFEDYANGYDDFDADAIADCFAFPATIWQFAKGNVFADREELLENIEALLEVFDREGIVHSSFEILAKAISGPSALMTLSWRQEREDGDPALAFICHYCLLRSEEGWRIGMIVNEH